VTDTITDLINVKHVVTDGRVLCCLPSSAQSQLFCIVQLSAGHISMCHVLLKQHTAFKWKDNFWVTCFTG